MSAATGFFRFLRRGDAAILMYHGISDYPFRFPVWTQLPTARFESHLAILSAAGYTVHRLADIVDCLVSGRPFPRRAVAITFDDGFASNATRALPLLEKYGAPATVFLTAELIGNDELIWTDRLATALLATKQRRGTASPIGAIDLADAAAASRAYRRLVGHLKAIPSLEKDRQLDAIVAELLPQGLARGDPLHGEFSMMNWSQARSMLASGLVDFGGHTCRHDILTRQAPDTMPEDVARCRRIIERELDQPVDLFAYPNGSRADFDGRSIDALKSGGWRAAVTTLVGHTASTDSVFELPRLGIGNDTKDTDLRYMLAGIGAWREARWSVRIASAAPALFTGCLARYLKSHDA